MAKNEKTSAPVASIASRVLAFPEDKDAFLVAWKGKRRIVIRWEEIRSLAASALTQRPDKQRWHPLDVPKFDDTAVPLMRAIPMVQELGFTESQAREIARPGQRMLVTFGSKERVARVTWLPPIDVTNEYKRKPKKQRIPKRAAPGKPSRHKVQVQELLAAAKFHRGNGQTEIAKIYEAQARRKGASPYYPAAKPKRSSP